MGPMFKTGLYSVQSIVPTIVLVDLGSHEIRPIHSAPSLGQCIVDSAGEIFNISMAAAASKMSAVLTPAA